MASTRSTGNDLQRAILDEARRVLEEQGYGALSTRRIASAVGCTATSIYLYFQSKDALVHALIDEGFEELNRRVLEATGGPGAPHERLRAAARAYVDFGLERPAYYEIMFMLRAEQMERYPAEAYRRARRSLEAFCELTGHTPEDALKHGTIVWATLHGLVSLLIARRVDVSLDESALVRDAIETACAGALEGSPTTKDA
ncbi:MAG: TetR/AcrR family transcriptional regulator [Planctomycetota bacterium]